MTGKQIRKLRERKGLTQADVAQALNLGQGTIGNWEAGHRRPNALNRKRLKALLLDETASVPAANQTQQEPISIYDIVYSAVQAGVSAGVALVMEHLPTETRLAYAAL